MPRTLYLCFAPDASPSRAALQTALKAMKLGLSLDAEYEPGQHEGYLPCTLEGEDAGVTLQAPAEQALPASAAALEAERGPRSLALRLRWGGDPREHLAALALAAAWAEAADALVVEPDQAAALSAEALIKQARRLHGEQF